LSYFEGTTGPLAKLGYSHDRRNGLLQAKYGLLTDARGCPVAVSVYGGKVAVGLTLLPGVTWLPEYFGIEQLII
jgi:transposase